MPRFFSKFQSAQRVWFACLLVAAGPGSAQVPATPWSLTAYLQQSWPKQTETNRQIREVNTTFGSAFKTWEDVANLNLGVLALRELDPRWKAGIEFDYSKGKISGTTTVDTPAGPAALAFEQKYSVYADLMAVVQFRPLGSHGRWVPFLQGGLGYAYQKGRSALTLRNDFMDEGLQAEDSGWFPVLTAGVGVDAYFSDRRIWFVEVGASYSWARLKHTVPATGSLAPAPTAISDTDSTGPNVWLGLGRRF